MLTHQRTPSAMASEVPVYLPTVDRLGTTIPPTLDVNAIARTWVSAFAHAVESKNLSAILACIHPDGWWRDLFALSWDLRSFHGAQQIGTFLKDRVIGQSEEVQFKINVEKGVKAELQKRYEDLEWLLVEFEFETRAGEGRLITYLIPSSPSSLTSGPWKAFVLATHLEGIKGHPERIGALRDPAP